MATVCVKAMYRERVESLAGSYRSGISIDVALSSSAQQRRGTRAVRQDYRGLYNTEGPGPAEAVQRNIGQVCARSLLLFPFFFFSFFPFPFPLFFSHSLFFSLFLSLLFSPCFSGLLYTTEMILA